MRVDFYHLTLQPLDHVLSRVAERIVTDGGRLLIVAGDASVRARLDQILWVQPPESFLPHAQAGGEYDACQPVLIAGTPEAANGARNIAFADGLWREEGLAFDRVFHFFDEERILEARVAWKALADRDGIERHYWKQNDGGGWVQAS